MIQDRLADYWSPPHYCAFRNVLIGKYGMIFDKDYKLIRSGNDQFNFWYYMRINWWHPEEWVHSDAAFVEADKMPVVRLPSGTYIYGLHFFNKYNYGHIWDLLQSLKIVEDHNIIGTLLTNVDKSCVTDFDARLSLFGYPADKRIDVDINNTIYHVPELVVPSYYCRPNYFSRDIKDWLLAKHMSCPDLSLDNVPRMLYLSRENGFGRKVTNEWDIVSSFPNLTVFSGLEPLQQQINLFNSATFICGYHGASFKNIIFCKNRPTIVEFCPNIRERFIIDGRSNFQEQSIELNITDNYHLKLVDTSEDFYAYIDPSRLHEFL